VILGIDPGAKKGALVFLSGTDVAGALAWSEAKRKGGTVIRGWSLKGGESEILPAMLATTIRRYIGFFPIHLAAVEGHPMRMGGRAHGLNVPHVREVGRVIGWVEALTNLSPVTPEPAEWRSAVFGIKRGATAKAIDAAILAALPLFAFPWDVPAWALKHLPDARGVALYAAMEKP